VVRRTWRSHGFQPHRFRQFKLSSDPNFIGKLRDVVGLFVDPPAHAIVLLMLVMHELHHVLRRRPVPA
jgi:hypothetical protein